MKIKVFCAVLILVVTAMLAGAQARSTFASSSASAAEEAARPETIAWISDTQNYISRHADIFESMTRWVNGNREPENIVYLVHTGDVISNLKKDTQWKTASEIMSLLGDVPLGIAAGNHDVGEYNANYDKYIKYFGEGMRAASADTVFWKGGKGQYDLVDINGRPFIILMMGYSIGEDDYGWINESLRKHSDRDAILGFHSYLDASGKRTSVGKKIFDNVVKPNPNVRMVLCGHRHGEYLKRVEIDGDGGSVRVVYEILANHQAEANGGDGKIVLMTFGLDGESVSVRTYSPWTDITYQNEEIRLYE